MATRLESENKFEQWTDNPDGTRTYWYEVKGKRDWYARYVKQVDANEMTISFRQEVYDQMGDLLNSTGSFPLTKDIKSWSSKPMAVSRKMVAQKIGQYLNRELPKEKLIAWCESAMQDETFEDRVAKEIVARLGLMDAKNFDVSYEDLSSLLGGLGYQMKVEVFQGGIFGR